MDKIPDTKAAVSDENQLPKGDGSLERHVRNFRCYWECGLWLSLRIGRLSMNLYPCGWKGRRITVKKWLARWHGGYHAEIIYFANMH